MHSPSRNLFSRCLCLHENAPQGNILDEQRSSVLSLSLSRYFNCNFHTDTSYLPYPINTYARTRVHFSCHEKTTKQALPRQGGQLTNSTRKTAGSGTWTPSPSTRNCSLSGGSWRGTTAPGCSASQWTLWRSPTTAALLVLRWVRLAF